MSAGKGKRRILLYKDHFTKFYDRQKRKVKMKIDWTIQLIIDLDRVPEKYFKHLEGTTLYEVRVQVGSDIYRIFCFFDKGNLVILLHGIVKKTQKTPRKELEKAQRLQKEYYDGKKK